MLVVVLCLCSCLLVVHAQDIVRNEDVTCKPQGHVQSVCKKLSECPQALQVLKEGKRPETCGFIKSDPLVCCASQSLSVPTLQASPLPQPSTPMLSSKPLRSSAPLASSKPFVIPKPQETAKVSSKSKQKCEEYAKAVHITVEDPINGEEVIKDTCEIEDPLIVGGYVNHARPKAYPHMALIGYGDKNTTWLCGGTLISERFVLSAAHCTDAGRRGEAKWVRLGDHDIDSMEDDDNGSAGSREYEITEIITHPEYEKSSKYNDIALYKLVADVQFGEFIRPICLETEYHIAETSAIYTAWEENMNGKEESRILKKSNLVIVGGKECNETFKEDSFRKILMNGIDDSSMLCASRTNERDSCRERDSGGPLQIRLRQPYCMYSQLGIDSFDRRCEANVPSIFTRVSHYVPWIESIVWP